MTPLQFNIPYVLFGVIGVISSFGYQDVSTFYDALGRTCSQHLIPIVRRIGVAG